MSKISLLPEVADPDGTETVVVLKDGVTKRVDLQPLAEAAMAPSLEEAAGYVEQVAASAPTSFAFAEAVAAEQFAFANAGKWVNNTGNDAAAGTGQAPYKSVSFGLSHQQEGPQFLMVANGQEHIVAAADVQFGGTNGGNPQPRHVWGYGEGAFPFTLTGRQDLSGKVFTLLAGQTETWETTLELAEIPTFNGVEIADNTKLPVWLDIGDPAGDFRFDWKTGNANVAANDAACIATRGSCAINLVGSTAGEIRATGSASRNVRLVLHMPDGSNPNGKRISIADRETTAVIYGSKWGHARVKGGTGKDTVAIMQLGGITATFRSLEVIDALGHGCVGLSTQIAGLFKAHLRPTPGESVAALGRTFGAGFVAYTGGYLNVRQFIGTLDVSNGTYGLFFHGNGNHAGYLVFDVFYRSKIENCSVGVQVGLSGTPGLPFITNGLTFHRGLDLIGGETAFITADDVITIKRGSREAVWKPVTAMTTTLAQFGGGGEIILEGRRVDMSGVTGARALFWNLPWGAHIALGIFPRLTLRDFHDDTTIGGGRYKMRMYAVDTATTNHGRGIIKMLGDVTLGDIWGANPLANIWPQALIADEVGEKRFGIGGKKRKDVEAAMAAAGRVCEGMINVTFVDKDDNVISPAGVVDPDPIIGADLVVGAPETAQGSWTGGVNGDGLAHGAGNFEFIRWQADALLAGGEFRVTFDVSGFTSGTAQIELGTGATVIAASAAGSYAIDVVRPAGGNPFIWLYAWPGFIGTITNLKVRPLTYP